MISATEVKEMLGASKTLKPAVVQAIIKEVDANGDGKVSFKEFVDMMKSNFSIWTNVSYDFLTDLNGMVVCVWRMITEL